MSWQDYEYGPADTDVDYLIDDGWMPPEEAEDLQALQAELAHTRVTNLALFVALLAALFVGFA